MGGDAEQRLAWKEPLQALEVELQRDFGLTPVASRALVRRLGEFMETYAGARPESRGAGQVCYAAVAAGERAGKPLRHCLTVPVKLTVLHASDVAVLQREGSPALRRVRLARLCEETVRQGGVLSHEDLSVLLGVEISTVRRLVADCAAEGERPPTRGLVDDIGPTVTHKEQVLRLYFRGLLPARVAARTGHSLGSVERYLSDFARVAVLEQQRLSPEAVARLTGLSPSLVARYRELVERYQGAAHRPVWERLLRRYAPLDLPRSEPDSEVGHG